LGGLAGFFFLVGICGAASTGARASEVERSPPSMAAAGARGGKRVSQPQADGSAALVGMDGPKEEDG
jgi:hypothetical protein